MEENELKIQFLITATGCTLEEAGIALEVSDGDDDRAMQMVELIRLRYLVLKSHFTASGAKSLQGVFLLILEEKSIQPLHVAALVINYSEDHFEINMDSDAIYWQQLISANSKERSKFDLESSIELKDLLENKMLPEPASQIWNLAREINEIKANGEISAQSNDRLKDIDKTMVAAISKLLEKYFKQALNVNVGVELLNKLRFADIAKALKLKDHMDDEDETQEETHVDSDDEDDEANEKPVIIRVRGKGVLDITSGIMARDLRVGDKIAVDIIERTQLAENLGRMLGLKSQGYWLHTWGVIRGIRDVDDGQRILSVEIAKNIFVDCSVMMEVRIRSNRQYPDGNRKEFLLESPSTVPGYIMIAGMMLFFGLLLKIVMVFINQ